MEVCAFGAIFLTYWLLSPWQFKPIVHNFKTVTWVIGHDVFKELQLRWSGTREELQNFLEEHVRLNKWRREVMGQSGSVAAIDELTYVAIHTDGRTESFKMRC